MSIVRLALRICARKAITGQTVAGELVRDSSINTLEAALTEAAAPIVLVYTEDCDAKPQGKEIWSPGSVDLTFLASVMGAYKVKVEGEDEEVTEFGYPTTDESSEMTLDVLERQIKVALTDPGNPWAQCFLRFVTSFEFWKSRRGASTKEGAKFAAREIVARCETVDEPPPGAAPVGAWARLLNLMEVDQSEDWGTVPALLRALIDGKPIPADFRTAMQQGLTREQNKAIGLGRVDLEVEGAENELPSYIVTELNPGRPL